MQGGVAGCLRTFHLVACEVILGFPLLDLWIRKMAFKVTCRLQSHSSKGGIIDWELVGQLGTQAPVVLDRGPKKWFLEKPLTVTIGERSEWVDGSILWLT